MRSKISSNPINSHDGRCTMQMGEKFRNVRNVLTITAAAVLALIGCFYLSQPFFPNVSNELMPIIADKFTSKIMTPYWSDKRFDNVDPDKERIMLSKGDGKIIDDIKIVYRGSKSRSQFQLDVYVLEFDREMPFAHILDVSKAKKGFRLANKNFKLISAHKNRIQLWHHKKRGR